MQTHLEVVPLLLLEVLPDHETSSDSTVIGPGGLGLTLRTGIPPTMPDQQKLSPTTTPVTQVQQQPPSYTVFSEARQKLILGLITVAGLFGPLAGNIYLPALPVLEHAFHVTKTEIDVTVTAFMVVFAFGVGYPPYFAALASSN